MGLPRAADSQWKQEAIERWLNTPSIPSDAREGLLEMLRLVKEEIEMEMLEATHDTFHDPTDRFEN